MVNIECTDCKQVTNKKLAKKIGTKYYCSNCGAYLEADKPKSHVLPQTWWRTTTGKR